MPNDLHCNPKHTTSDNSRSQYLPIRNCRTTNKLCSRFLEQNKLAKHLSCNRRNFIHFWDHHIYLHSYVKVGSTYMLVGTNDQMYTHDVYIYASKKCCFKICPYEGKRPWYVHMYLCVYEGTSFAINTYVST
jgi:hypothetical protein